MTAADTNTAPIHHGYAPRQNWFARAERWLDERGKLAWVGTIILGFVAVWPVGLALLFYVLFFKRGGMSGACTSRRMRQGFSRMTGSTGNSAFDAYKADTLRRLEEEQQNFEAFLERLREAKDKAEFDQFMNDRARKAGNGDDTPGSDDSRDAA